jgi:transcriptional regulator with XRE-family HTH domain
MHNPAMDMDTDIPSRLDEAMTKRAVKSQSELARLSKVPQPTINRILKRVGTKGPEASTLKKLADALDVRFEWLHEGTGEMLRENGSRVESPRSEGWNELTRVDAFEHRILSLVRKLDARGKREAESALEELVNSLSPGPRAKDASADGDN